MTAIDPSMEIVMSNPFVASHRLPVIFDWYPKYYYHVALAIPDVNDSGNMWGLAIPTENEQHIVALYLHYIIERQGYYPNYLKQMREKAIVDIDPGYNTTILGKGAQGWQYRKSTFSGGPWPVFNDTFRFERLVDLLDHIERFSGTKWTDFKELHQDILA